MLITEKVNNCNIAYEDNYSHSVREYYLYVVGLFKQELQNLPGQANFIFGDFDYDFNNNLPIKRIVFQYEHTLVKPGGRDSDGFPLGGIPIADSEENKRYLVRLCNYQSIAKADTIIDYSIPNIVNVRTIDKYPRYCKKVRHISACLYDIDFNGNRSLEVTSNFYDPSQPRRYKLLKALEPFGIKNHTGIYGHHLINLYSASKILINIHQTDHHDTLEELRVLPALRRGAIIISEPSALQDHIAYRNHIVWADYKDIPDVVSHVLSNYDNYHRGIFNDRLSWKLKDLEEQNKTSVADGILQCMI